MLEQCVNQSFAQTAPPCPQRYEPYARVGEPALEWRQAGGALFICRSGRAERWLVVTVRRAGSAQRRRKWKKAELVEVTYAFYANNSRPPPPPAAKCYARQKGKASRAVPQPAPRPAPSHVYAASHIVDPLVDRSERHGCRQEGEKSRAKMLKQMSPTE